jgi:hypothetical protein
MECGSQVGKIYLRGLRILLERIETLEAMAHDHEAAGPVYLQKKNAP